MGRRDAPGDLYVPPRDNTEIRNEINTVANVYVVLLSLIVVSNIPRI